MRSALARGRGLACARCGGRGATVGCRVPACAATFHLPCAAAAGAAFEEERYAVACPEHAPWFVGGGGDRSGSPPPLPRAPPGAPPSEVAAAARAAAAEAAARARAAARLAAAERDDSDGDAEAEARFRAREARRHARDWEEMRPVVLGGDPAAAAAAASVGPPWCELAGARAAVAALRSAVLLPLLYPRLLAASGVTAPAGVLLHGPPGCGKTHAVRALARAAAAASPASRVSLFARRGADCLGKYAGDCERNLRLLFDEAAAAAREEGCMSIIFLDEVDGLAPARAPAAAGGSASTHASAVATLLALLDGVTSRGRVAVLAATNRPDAVDPALRRAGRFDREVAFGPPSARDRAAVLSVHTRRWPVRPPRALLAAVASATGGWGGADLAALAAGAALAAARRCAPVLFETGAGDVAPLLKGEADAFISRVRVRARDWRAALRAAPPPAAARGLGGDHPAGDPLGAHLAPWLGGAAAAALAALRAARVPLPAAVAAARDADAASAALIAGGECDATICDPDDACDGGNPFLPASEADAAALAAPPPPPPPCRLLLTGDRGAAALAAALVAAVAAAGGAVARFGVADAAAAGDAPGRAAAAVQDAVRRASPGVPGLLWLPDAGAWAVGRAGDWEEEEEGGRDDDASSRPSPLFAVLRTALDDAPPGSVAVLASWGGGAAPDWAARAFTQTVDAAGALPAASAARARDASVALVSWAIAGAVAAAARAARRAAARPATPQRDRGEAAGPPPPPHHSVWATRFNDAQLARGESVRATLDASLRWLGARAAADPRAATARAPPAAPGGPWRAPLVTVTAAAALGEYGADAAGFADAVDRAARAVRAAARGRGRALAPAAAAAASLADDISSSIDSLLAETGAGGAELAALVDAAADAAADAADAPRSPSPPARHAPLSAARPSTGRRAAGAGGDGLADSSDDDGGGRGGGAPRLRLWGGVTVGEGVVADGPVAASAPPSPSPSPPRAPPPVDARAPARLATLAPAVDAALSRAAASARPVAALEAALGRASAAARAAGGAEAGADAAHAAALRAAVDALQSEQ